MPATFWGASGGQECKVPVSVCFRGCQLKDTEEGCVGGAQSAWGHECKAMLCLEISGGARGGLMAENKEARQIWGLETAVDGLDQRRGGRREDKSPHGRKTAELHGSGVTVGEDTHVTRGALLQEWRMRKRKDWRCRQHA